MTTATQANAAVAVSPRGFPGMRCLCCGEPDQVSLDLAGLDTLRCGSCENEMSLDDVREQLALWGRFVRWVDSSATVE